MIDGIQLRYLRRSASPSASPVLEVRDLAVRVGLRTVFSGINVSLRKGEIARLDGGGEDVVVVTGPNGSGKSSLLNAVAGLPPALITAGTVFLRGIDVTQWPAHRRCGIGLAYMRQRDNVFSKLTVEENLIVALGASGPKHFVNHFPKYAPQMSGKVAETLSGGERQILAWAMTILRGGDILLADEPEGGLAASVELPHHMACLLVAHSIEALWEKLA
jgi:ABC-type branched-subunit amino acid transport system ATPase component